jgi:hypothetical protein
MRRGSANEQVQYALVRCKHFIHSYFIAPKTNSTRPTTRSPVGSSDFNTSAQGRLSLRGLAHRQPFVAGTCLLIAACLALKPVALSLYS